MANHPQIPVFTLSLNIRDRHIRPFVRKMKFASSHCALGFLIVTNYLSQPANAEIDPPAVPR
jgi:hypothetical protein